MVDLIRIVVAVVLVPVLALLLLHGLLFALEYLLGRVPFGRLARFALVAIKSLRRNPVRTSLTYMAAFVLVAVVTIVWSALAVLERFMQAKTRDVKVVITDKWRAISEMPFGYAGPLMEGAANSSRTGQVRPQDGMTWQGYSGAIDAIKKTRENTIDFVALEPRKAVTVMDRLFQELPQQSKQQSGRNLDQVQEFLIAIDAMEKNKRGVILGRNVLERIHKQVGDRFGVTGTYYNGIDLQFDIVGQFPPGRYNEMAIMHRDYLNDAIDGYPRTHGGQRHPLADRTLNVVLLEVPDSDSYSQVAKQIESSPLFRNPSLRCETLSSFAVSQLEAYRDLIWAMRWFLAPAILSIMALVLANAISLSVRERRTEMAILKVLGYRPAQILALVLGEAVLLGALSGVLSAGTVYEMVNRLVNTADSVLPIYIPDEAIWWGPAAGALMAVAGSLLPALSACRVRVSEVFARIG
jgi:putative ABC transport system permease protein